MAGVSVPMRQRFASFALTPSLQTSGTSAPEHRKELCHLTVLRKMPFPSSLVLDSVLVLIDFLILGKSLAFSGTISSFTKTGS